MDYKDKINLGCTINICGLSKRSKFMLNKFIHERDLCILAIQETNSCDDEQLELLNMTCYKDSNRAMNRGCALYISQDLKSVHLPQIGSYCNCLDSVGHLLKLVISE